LSLQGDDEEDDDFELDMDDIGLEIDDMDDDEEEPEQMLKQKKSNAKQLKNDMNLKMTPLKGANNSKGLQTPKEKTPRNVLKKETATPKILGKRNAKSLYIRNLPEHVTVNELKDLSPDIVNVMTYDIKGSPSACLEFVSEDKAGYNYQILRGRKLKGQVMEIDFVGKKSKKMSADEKKPNDKLHITRIPLDASIADVAVHFPMASKITLKKSTLDRYAIISFRNEKCANEAFNSKIEIKGQTLTIKRFSLNDLGQNGKENGSKRVNWPLGKVFQLIEGKDGVVRLAKIRTKHDDLLRLIQHLYQLEVSCPIGEDLHQRIEGHTISDKRVKSNISSDSLSLVPDSGEGLPPKFVPQRINRYRRTLRATCRLDF
ncbi:DUF5641 domain-containing protein, partial [Nephila pilipes]